MANERKNIDKLFSDHLVGHRVSAPAGAWDRLQADLQPTKKRGAFFYIKLAAASFLLLLAFGAGYLLSEFGSDNTKHSASNTETIKQPGLDATAPSIKASEQYQEFKGQENKDEGQQLLTDGSGEEFLDTNSGQDVVHQTQPGETNQKTGETILLAGADQDKVKSPATKPDGSIEPVAQGNNIGEKSDGIIESVVISEEFADLAGDEGDQNLAAEEKIDAKITEQTVVEVTDPNDAIADELKNMSPEELHQLLVGHDEYGDDVYADNQTKSVSGWSVGGQLSPTYSYRSLSGSAFETPDESVDKSYFNDAENGLASMGGGIALAYNFNDRLSLGSGLYLSRIGQENTDVVAYDSPDSQYMYKLATSSGTVSINPTKFDRVLIEQIASPKDSIPGDYLVNGTFVQNLDYLEVPLVLNYKVLNKRFSVKVSGGLSPGLLVNNRSYFNLDGEKIQTGYTENIKPMIYNSVVGLGMGYDISTKLSINLSPTFKYSLSPVNSGSTLNYHPYSISLFTGISYKL